jgi:glycosyltransferase involved in cell wall biosynthesis
MNDVVSKKLSVAIIGTVGVPACYGGFESLVDNLLDFTPQNVEYTVFCSAKKYKNRLETYKGANLIYLDMDANGKDSILYDFKSMKIAISKKADIMLILGVSGCMFLPYIRRKFKGKIITNIDGLEWRRDKWKWYAKKLLKFSEKMAVKYSDIVIGDNKGITDYVKSEYKKDAVLIAYGGDQVSHIKDDSLYEKYPFCQKPYAVTVCRIEPENNIHLILEAFSKQNEKRLF